MKTKTKCTDLNHYHVMFELMGSYKQAMKIVLANSPEDALQFTVSKLPTGWRGGVSVYDDSYTDTDEMPLVHQYVGQ